ncbi:MAG: hypothetical protein IPL84_14430 [Chitinophagaceae bacterium]|nr:hypothetical protein [Chitinophagaceae bacterium]
MKQLLMIISVLAMSTSLMAQENQRTTKKSRKEEKRAKINAQIRAEEEGVIAYRKHYAFGVKLYTDGYGISFEKGYSKSVKKATLYQIEITERKHQKEEKQNNVFSNSSPFIFGKINFFYPIRLGVQKQFLLGNKSNKNGVSITANLGGGIALGLLRAYEVEVDDGLSGRKFITYDSPDSLTFADPTGLQPSGPGLSRGWDKLKFTPGLYAKPGIRFDYGRYNDLLAAIEVGVLAEFYSKKIPQMVYNKEQQFFFSAYFTILFGKRK